MDEQTRPEAHIPERRAMPRARTQRDALFSMAGSAGAVRNGTVADISPNGVQMRTATPEPEGTPLIIDFAPRPQTADDIPMSVRGRVVWVRPLENGLHAMGIWISMHLPDSGLGTPHFASAGEARDAAEALGAQLRRLNAEEAAPLTFAAIGQTAAFQAAPVERHGWHWARWSAGGAALLLLLLLLPLTCGDFLRQARPRAGAGIASTRSTPAPPSGTGGTAQAAGNRRADARGRIRAGQLLLAAARPQEAAALFHELLAGAGAGPMEKYLGWLGQAQAQYGQGETGRAWAALEAAAALEDRVPPVWRHAGAELREAMLAATEAARLPGMFGPVLELQPPGEKAGVQGQPAGGPPHAPEAGGRPAPPSGAADTGSSAGLTGMGGPLRPVPEEMARKAQTGAVKAPRDNAEAPANVREPADHAGRGPVETASEPRIEVDKSDYVLRVYRGGNLLGEFPVGLGANRSTPTGDFAVANKLTNPDWYDRGRVVPHGNPENPLGASWMGLGRGGQATSYGIHPTDEPESIGANESRGCIRLRPRDARKVFTWCPIGTPVCIRP